MAKKRSNGRVMRVPPEFDEALSDFQMHLKRTNGVDVPKAKIMKGLAPKLGGLMRKDCVSEPILGKYKRKKGWRFEFL